ncbi:MAG: bifunctional riboflavin kinase/FAD synthetase [Spirulinaceae cyanobacterium SM2_1_0]|nr:bifunctional riboflavin kinase/FAD synthetase [Spirulinaceae cyanobacterium SM2_1_0]
MQVISTTAAALKPTAIALGNFDGVHRGHQAVIQPVLQRELALAGVAESSHHPAERVYSTVVTFTPHPREFFTGDRRPLLTPLAEKVQQFAHLGLEQLVLLPFDHDLARLSPAVFVEEILLRQLQAQRISIGADFHFGRDRAGTATDLQMIAARHGCEVAIAPLQTLSAERISSSRIRTALAAGEVATANHLLGRAYALIGTVVRGQQLGRQLGFPTANLQLPTDKVLPRYGVYAAQVTLGNDPQTAPRHAAVINLGCRPTVNAGDAPTVEVHLLDWQGDLYGQELAVSLQRFLRPEQRFDSLDALKAQIQQDCTVARQQLAALDLPSAASPQP